LGAQENYMVWGPVTIDRGLCYKIGSPELNYSITWMQNKERRWPVQFNV